MRSTGLQKLETFVIGGLLLGATGCDLSEIATQRFLASAGTYFNHRPGQAFETIASGVHSFRQGFNRNLVVETTAGLVIVDPFNPQFAAALADKLRARFPGQPVHTLVYSHYHLDHVRGGALLDPGQIIGHRKLAPYWRFIDDDAAIAPPTRSIAGDQRLQIGGVRFDLLYMDLSHPDTLYAVHLPGAGVLFAPDLGFVRAVPPAGMPDMYYPGYVRALERLAARDFAHYVPSHFDTGTRADLIAYIQFLRTGRELVLRAYSRHGPVSVPGAAEHYYAEVYKPLAARYGDWLGFDEMALPFLIRNLAGGYLGY